MSANMTTDVIYFWCYRLSNASVVLLAQENILVDTKIPGLRLVQAELYHFEENHTMADKMAANIMSTQVVFLLVFIHC